MTSVLTSLTKERSAGGDKARSRLTTPGEVADVVDAVLYFENAPFVTGWVLQVDGSQGAGNCPAPEQTRARRTRTPLTFSHRMGK
jgi:hypothetical protein